MEKLKKAREMAENNAGGKQIADKKLWADYKKERANECWTQAVI